MTTYQGPAIGQVEGVGPLTLGSFLVDVAGRFADREAIAFRDPLAGGETVRWTYADLLQRSHQVAAGLIARGVGLGTRVGIVMANRPEFVSALFGVAMAGGVATPLSTFSTSDELADLLRRSGVAGVLGQAQLGGRALGDELVAAVTEAEKRTGDHPFLGWSACVGDGSWDELVAGGVGLDAVVDARTAAVGPGDPGLILYSSGTTSAPKGVLHVHRAPSLQFWLQADVFRRTPDARVWAPLPLFWTAGLTTALGPTLARGGCVVLQEIFDAGDALALIEAERVTEPYTLPHQAAALTEHPDWETRDLSSLREVYGKSVFHRHPTVDGDETWNFPVGYGMSETCASIITHRWDTPRAELKRSTGRLIPGARLRIVDPDTGEALGPGQDGEIALAGLTVLDRYVGKTREETFDADGFLRTGDAGFVDSDGAVHWTGRRTEMIKTAGANVSPAEIEVALRACRPVKRSKIVGVPDTRLGEAVVACIELVDGESITAEEVRAFLAERVAKYKVPRHVLFFSPGEMPTTASDTKVRDDELIALVRARLAADTATDTPTQEQR